MKITVFIATSLDGFIARSNGDIDWLMKASEKAVGEDYGYNELIQSIDYLVMGRGCFEAVVKFPEWSYEGTKVIVLSKSIKEIPSKLKDKVELYNGSIKLLYQRLQQENCKRIYIDGGKIIQSFLREELVTEMIITKIPVLIGDGIPLFADLEKDIPLKLVEAKTFPSGLARMHYQL